MTPEKYQRLSDLFARGSELDDDQRRTLLQSLPQDDVELRDELARLFHLDDSNGLAAADELAAVAGDDGNHHAGDAASQLCPNIPGYVIGDLLGEGGMGQVWRAHHRSTHRDVALKLMHGLRLTSSQNRARFEREVELMARLAHPNVARVFDSGFAEGYAFYTLELIDGQPLDTYIRHDNPNELTRIELMLQVCRGVQHAHQRGVIHRDLKPSNVLVTTQGRPVVVDFGLAKCIGDVDDGDRRLTRGVVIGTPEYMSPEQAAGGSTLIDTRSDVYSLGVILYWLLTDRLPHGMDDGQSRIGLLARVATEDITSPRRLAPHLDRGLIAVLYQSLARDPNDRYSSVGELADDLQRHLQGEPVAAASAGFGYVLKRRLLKHRKQAVLGLLALAAVVSAITAFVAISHRHARVAMALAKRAEESQRVARAAERDALRSAYVQQLALAANETENFQFARAVSLLDSCPAEQRGWEWQLLRNLATPRDRSLFKIGPIADSVRPLAFSPDGSLLALGTSRGTLESVPEPVLWVCDTTTGAVKSRMIGHRDGIFAIAFTPDGRQLLTGARDRTLRRWDVETGELLETVEGPIPGLFGPVEVIGFSICFRPDGQQVAFAAYPQGLYMADIDGEISWREILRRATHVRYGTGEDDSLTFSPDGKRLAWSTRLWQGNVGHLFVVDTATKHVLEHVELPSGEPCYSVDFDPLGKTLLTADLRSSATVYASDLSAVQGRFRVDSGAVHQACYTRDGSAVVTLSMRGAVTLWDNLTRRVDSVIRPQIDASSGGMRLSPDRSRLAVAAGAPTFVRLWDMTQVRHDDRLLVRHAPKARDVAVTPNGKLIATCGDDRLVHVYRWPERELLWTHTCEQGAAT
ncbi:MAG: protein kinase, partial [Planctomycetales bacterium]|nr:protein kinase [Planctomycetales bacterium]